MVDSKYLWCIQHIYCITLKQVQNTIWSKKIASPSRVYLTDTKLISQILHPFDTRKFKTIERHRLQILPVMYLGGQSNRQPGSNDIQSLLFRRNLSQRHRVQFEKCFRSSKVICPMEIMCSKLGKVFRQTTAELLQ